MKNTGSWIPEHSNIKAAPKITKDLINLLKQQSREQFAKKDWSGATQSLLKLKKYLPPDDPQQKQIDQRHK